MRTTCPSLDLRKFHSEGNEPQLAGSPILHFPSRVRFPALVYLPGNGNSPAPCARLSGRETPDRVGEPIPNRGLPLMRTSMDEPSGRGIDPSLIVSHLSDAGCAILAPGRD